MPLRSRLNQYRGVNAHLHSVYQHSWRWHGFHGVHINDLATALNNILPSGYLVDMRTGLDVDYLGVVILAQESWQPVTKIELLSPAVKSTEGLLDYVPARHNALMSGVCLVEIDYLHETPSPIRGIPNYPQCHPNAAAYNITISNPIWGRGTVKTYLIGVDAPLPTLLIPLEGEDSVQLDFGVVYHQTFHSLPIYSLQVDYAELPAYFESYHPEDQTRIKRRMEAIQQAAAEGVDLDAVQVVLPDEIS